MRCRETSAWPLTTGDHSKARGEPVAIEVYNDHEDPTYAALYIRYQDGVLIPARTVAPADPLHWDSVLTSWSRRAPLKDCRENPIPPLPIVESQTPLEKTG